ncbi:MAG: ABC transporter ATP-binding protein [Paracoccus sp. (in: a-proteobacteria)]|uniref:ABC transporter ATP-binding protein n=1 Tax=Paracoccus sp. TaxID=267 RepID=UPI0039E3F628
MSLSLRLDAVSSGYGDIRVLRDLSLSLNAGEIVAMLGRNGAGKTTALRTIAGLVDCGGGSIRIAEHDVTGAPAYRRTALGLAFVQEGKRIFPRRTVEENLTVGGWLIRDRRLLRQRIDEAYARFPILGRKRHDPAGTMSGGQQQMLAISQALMPAPHVLLLDEPSVGLAPSIVGEVFEVIGALRQEGMSILLVEQSTGWALSVADRIAVLETGGLIYDGPLGTARANQALERLHLTKAKAG